MGVIRREEREVQARIVYFGASGAGTTSNLKYIHRKLRREHRGELRSSPVKTTGRAYEFLPVELGQVRGLATTLHVYTVPGGDGARRSAGAARTPTACVRRPTAARTPRRDGRAAAS
jgi:hypothetical protein